MRWPISGPAMPSKDAIGKVCRGNMIPVWNFLVNRVKSEKTVEKIRRNITVHGGGNLSRSDVVGGGSSSGGGGVREVALKERFEAEREVERLRQVLRRQRKELKSKMLEVSREECERKRMLDDRSNLRHKQVTLEAYDRQCDEAAKIFSEYHKRLRYYANQARNSQRSSVDLSTEVASSIHGEKGAVYSTVKGAKASEDVILIETTRERNIRKICEYLASNTLDQIRYSFPAFEGNGVHSNPQLEAAKLSYVFDGDIPEEVRIVIEHCLRSPPLLLQAITSYSQRLKSLITRENENVDVRADAETLRYKYENDQVMDASAQDMTAPLHYQDNGKVGSDLPSKGSGNQLLERQKAHVQQFVATEGALNKAAEARNVCQKLLVRLNGSGDVINSRLHGVGGMSQNVGSLRPFQSLLPKAKTVIFVVSTTGQGDPPDSMKVFWRFLKQVKLSKEWLKGVDYGVFGLGDSGYQKYNFVAIRLDNRLLELGGKPLIDKGLGNDQHPSGDWDRKGGIIFSCLKDYWGDRLNRYHLIKDYYA